MNTRARSPLIASLLAVAAVVALTGAVLAKGVGMGGYVTLAQPIPRDAAPGSTISVTFTAMVDTGTGPSPVYMQLETSECFGCFKGEKSASPEHPHLIASARSANSCIKPCMETHYDFTQNIRRGGPSFGDGGNSGVRAGRYPGTRPLCVLSP